MSVRIGSVLLGDPAQAFGGSSLQEQRAAYVQSIGNGDQAAWLTFENRLSAAVNVQPKQSGQAGGSGAGPVTIGGWTIPSLSLGCVPIDPLTDVVVSVARTPNIDVLTRRSGGGASTELLNGPVPRTCPWMLSPQGGPHVSSLYPLTDCIILSVEHNVAAGITSGDLCYDLGNTGNNALLVPDVTVSGPVPRRPWYPRTPGVDSCIMAVQCAITNLGASSVAQDLDCTLNPTTSIGSVPGQLDVQLFGSSAAAANLPAVSPIVAVPGVGAVQWTNAGTTAIRFIATYWVGLAHDPPAG